MDIKSLIKIYTSIVKQYEDEQKRYQIDDYSQGVLSAYKHVLVDLEEYVKNYEDD